MAVSQATGGSRTLTSRNFPGLSVSVESREARADVRLRTSSIAEGIDIWHITVTGLQDAGDVALVWHLPIRGAHFVWRPDGHTDRTLRPAWAPSRVDSDLLHHAPVLCVFGAGDRNALCVAASEPVHRTLLSAGVVEETAEVRFRVVLSRAVPPVDGVWRVDLRVDRRPIHMARVLEETAAWWETHRWFRPDPPPAAAREPVYSTWYSFHQRVTAAEVEEQCARALSYGLTTVILDDGWQTSDAGRGYAFCGDWEPCRDKFPDFAGHIRRVRDMGMKYMVWLGLPFVGRNSRAWRRFRRHALPAPPDAAWVTLDPRCEEVRTHLTELVLRMVREYGVDGLKLDFLDAFHEPVGDGAPRLPLRDRASVLEAAAQWLRDLRRHLHSLKPDLLLEFRQAYIGPAMRRVGNMFRAADVPVDFLGQRIRTLDLRLLSRSTAVHSDMIMWREDATAEEAALQHLNGFFAVPQISVRLDRLPPEHEAMLRFLLNLWRDQRHLWLEGSLEPQGVEGLYPCVVARADHECGVAVYAPSARINLGEDVPTRCTILNATPAAEVVLSTSRAWGRCRVQAYSCTGVPRGRRTVRLGAGIHRFAVPPSGVLRIETT